LRGFCPTSQLALRGAPVDATTLVGHVLHFQVTEIKDGGRNIVLSRRKSLEADALEGREAALRSLEIGKIMRGTVSGVREFGAFVDLGGIEGLIPASEIAHERVNVFERIAAGESVDVQVLEIKDDDKGQKRITLSLKALLPAPEKPTPKPGTTLDIGSIVQGRVVRVESYGVFIQVNGTEGRDGRGLIPSAELAPRGADLRKAFPENTVLTAKILENGGGRLKLSVRGVREALERADFEAHKEKVGPETLGTFGDLLKKSGAMRGPR
jgi:small subunit ribosomal protein S1